jgi:hypothetical protein
LNVTTLRALQLDALPIFRLHRLFIAPMVCNAPIYPLFPTLSHMLSPLAHLFQSVPLFHMRTPIHYGIISRRSPHLSAYVSTLFGRVPHAYRVVFATVDFAHCAACGVHMTNCQRATQTEVRNNGKQCKQINPTTTAPPFLLAFSHIHRFFT